ncbi:protein MTSS 1 isoform X1 [Ixodes scapularis]
MFRARRTPPSSPSSLGSRKSSMCSISSFNSSSSGSTKSHSPSHRSLSQQPAVGPPLRLSSVSSQDSGFTSQDTLFLRPPSPRSAADVSAQVCDPGGTACASSTPASPFPPSVTSTWPNLQDTLQFERAMSSVLKCQRPHTISSADLALIPAAGGLFFSRIRQHPRRTPYIAHHNIKNQNYNISN